MVKLSAPVAVFGMILFGTSCSLLAKLIYSVEAPSIYGSTQRYEKPWFQVLAMFAGMSICILLDLPKRTSQPLISHDEQLALLHPQTPPPPAQSVWIISLPTLFDLFATACGTTGLLYTTVSVYQMLRGAMLVWTAILSILFLGRKLTRLNYLGISFCVAGIALVGMANVWAEDTPGSQSDTLFGIAIILLGQILQAAQVVMEEFLLQGLQMSSVRVVAWEGLFGMAHCLLWVFPILYFLPGRDHGHLENALDAFYMLTHSWAVAAVILTDMTMMLFYNVCGMEVTDSLSAVHRVVIETLRTLCVWLADLFIYYVLSGGRLGENWNQYSWLQFGGFVLLVFGTILYNYDNLVADYERRRKKSVQAVAEDHISPQPSSTLSQVTEYDAITSPPKPPHVAVPVTKPVAVDEDDFVEERSEGGEDEHFGSYYGQTVGSVAHSPFLLAASGTPTSYGSLRLRATFSPSTR